jgi:glycosyltransferase involved in cell wall biosynthesis
MYSYNNPLKHYYNSVMTKGEKVIAVSNFIAEHINQAYNISYDKIEVIHRGVDLDYFNPASVNQQRTIQMSKKLHIPTDRPIILLPGRLTRWKGQKFLLEALRLLPRSSFFCLIVGSSNGHSGYLKELGHIITKYELQNDVCITNNVIDMPALYMLADLVISASVQPEAFGRIVTEAQAMGRLLIATNIGGTCETVIDEVTGWKVEPYDVKGLAAKIAYALSLSPEERKSKMIASRDHITTNFSVGKMCQKTIDIYNSLLDLN